MAADYHLFRSIGEDIKRMYRNDEENEWAADSLISFVSRQEGLYDRYELAGIYLQYGQFDNMQSVLNNIPNNFELNELQTTNYQNYLVTFAIARDISENEKVPGDLNETQISDLESIMQTEQIVDKSMALSLLKWNNPDYAYDEIILVPEQNSQRKAKPMKKPVVKEKVLTVFPNPANDYFTIQYKTSDFQYTNLSLVVQDISGRKLISRHLKGGNNDDLVDTKDLISGIYTVLLYGDGTILSSQKLTIIK